MHKIIIVALLLGLPEVSFAEEYSSAVQLVEIQKYGAFRQFHPEEEKYDWVDDFYQVKDEKLLFLAARGDEVFVGWGNQESSTHDHIYRDSVTVVADMIFYAARNDGVYHLHVGSVSRDFSSPICWVTPREEDGYIIVTWKDCNTGKITQNSWEIAVKDAVSDAHH